MENSDKVTFWDALGKKGKWLDEVDDGRSFAEMDVQGMPSRHGSNRLMGQVLGPLGDISLREELQAKKRAEADPGAHKGLYEKDGLAHLEDIPTESQLQAALDHQVPHFDPLGDTSLSPKQVRKVVLFHLFWSLVLMAVFVAVLMGVIFLWLR